MGDRLVPGPFCGGPVLVKSPASWPEMLESQTGLVDLGWDHLSSVVTRILSPGRVVLDVLWPLHHVALGTEDDKFTRPGSDDPVGATGHCRPSRNVLHYLSPGSNMRLGQPELTYRIPVHSG